MEPGCDGVGDYTRRLATELGRMGHECLCVALNDRHCPATQNEYDNSGFHGPESFPAPVWRCPARLPWKKRLHCLQVLVDEFKPEWISLQYVPHGYNVKGAPYSLVHYLPHLRGKHQWHVMCHELWLQDETSMKRRALGKLQKYLLTRLCRRLPAARRSTSIELYKRRLAMAGISASILPLLSNIRCFHCDPAFRRELLASLRVENAGEAWIFAIFGTIRPGWDHDELFKAIEQCRIRERKQHCVIISAGNQGAYGEKVWEKMVAEAPSSFILHKTGILPEEGISRLFQSADFGIAIAPLHYLGKSGSAVAMQSHGLPIIIVRENAIMSEWLGENPSGEHAILMNEDFCVNLKTAKRRMPVDNARNVAEKFVATLARGANCL